MDLKKCNEKTDQGGFHKEKITHEEVDFSQNLKNLGETIPSEDTTGEVDSQYVEEIIRAVCHMEKNEVMEESDVVLGARDLFTFDGADEIDICSQETESSISDGLEDIESKQNQRKSEKDSDATVSSSESESCDELTDYLHQREFPIQKSAAWGWAKDRASVVCRWTWLQAQVANLNYKIRQTTEIKHQLRAAKGAVTLEQPSEITSNGHGGTDDSFNGDSDGSCSRTRGLVRTAFRKRKLVQLNGLPDPTQPADPLYADLFNAALPVNQRLARLDPAYHPVLSFTSDALQSLHYDSILNSAEWQSRAMQLPTHKSNDLAQPPMDETIVMSKAAREAASSSGLDLARKHLNGSRQHLNGSRQHLNGSGQHLNGSRQHLNGSGQHLNGSGQHVNGSRQHLNGSGQHLNGSRQHLNGSRQHLNGSGQHLNGSRLPAIRQQLLPSSSQQQSASLTGATDNELELRPKPTSAMSISTHEKVRGADGGESPVIPSFHPVGQARKKSPIKVNQTWTVTIGRTASDNDVLTQLKTFMLDDATYYIYAPRPQDRDRLDRLYATGSLGGTRWKGVLIRVRTVTDVTDC
ncbi:hypothetical protein AAG570_008144 [Ranatra chinensis]|uniref:Uncharacterized protein n=1 Tax=Ranatra chinensis TaxID=642074 RepID=A0ABD0XTX3_9HEMI